MKYITWDEFESNAKSFLRQEPSKHWKNYKRRWPYHQQVIELIQSMNLESPKDILEVGTMGAQIVKGSDTIDMPKRNLLAEPTYRYDIRKTPWAFLKDKQYKLLVSLRVWQHLEWEQPGCFREARRVSENTIILVPETYKNGCGIKPAQFKEWNKGVEPDKIIQAEKQYGNIFVWLSK